ncbi:nucleolar pre-ribosomal-associated protein 1 [Takifugu flavidus]|uniref:Nucleolar pre-ribosomal-associated protein 1 n=1 Tax=Takifugu flavidus TaxID=433684 RepID=A0A5C6PDS8_9TELE|nr:nucleolar pre-ribosomal-associated protein 1 [Takifugu flavidus]TWW76931.1 Nucleolar pre-ribosomal-associated protein 1 [Takifugu flavidus]
MGKKRISGDSGGSTPPEKIQKVMEFSGIAFKTMLKEPTSAMKGLEAFISAAKKLPSSDVYDVVEGYIKISMECTEIFKLLEGEKHLETELILIFESLEMILLRTASDLSHFSMVGNAVVKKTVSGYMKLLQSSLHSSNHRFVRQCLSFLTALVSQGPEAAREILSCIHINKSLSGLAKRKDKKGRPDVRMAFVQFVLSFLVSGDNATIGQVLEFKELLPEILCTGIKEDRMSIVNLILSTLKTRVVLNKAISKTQKINFFTPALLANVASLYKWNGLVDLITDDNMEEGSDHAGISAVRDLVHSFLTDLCSSRKHGISFHDASYGTAGRSGNIVLLKFLVGLKQATEDALVADLVVSVLKVCPDILARYFQETQYSYTPRCKSAWQENVQLLKKIYDAQPEISTIFQTAEVIPLQRLLSMILVVSLPPVCNKPFFTQGLNLANTAVQLTTLSMINFILKRAIKNIEYLLEKSEWHNSKGYTHDMTEELLQLYREALSKILPDITSVIAKWQSLSKKEKMNDEGKNIPTEGSVTQTDDKKENPAAETAEVILLKALILQVLCLYQKVVPHVVSQCKFDFSKLFKGIVSDKGMREEVPPVLQYQILQLALELPASKFSWFRIQDVADSESSGEKSVLYLLLKMFVSSGSSHLKTSTRSLILKVLKDSGVFEYTWTELEIWLNQLARVDPNQQETVIQFLERVLGKLVNSSYTYTDKVASLVQEAAYLQDNLSSQEGETASTPVSHIDDIINMLDVIMESAEGEMQEFGPSLSEELILQTFPFSVLVPAALEARNKLPGNKEVVFEYVSAVLCDVLHCQREPLPLCLALLQYDKELVSSQPSASPHPSIISLNEYYSKWLPRQCQEPLFKSSEGCSGELSSPSSFNALMKAAYSQGMSTLLEDAFRKKVEETLSSISMAEYPVAVKQILLYINSTLENVGTFPKEIGIRPVRTLMGILLDLVTSLKDHQESTNSVPTAEMPQEGSELFLEINQSSAEEANKEQILLSVLGSIFKHPCLKQWFLALELSALPPHTLKPVRLKHLCTQLNEDILALLKTSAPILHDLAQLDLVCSYMEAIEKSVLKEVMEKSSEGAKKESKPFQALLSLHCYLDSFKLNEVVSKLLLLPQQSLILPMSKATQAELSVYGHAAVQILTQSKANSSLDRSIFLSQAHLHGLGTLFLSCSSPTLEAFLLQTLSDEPGSAKLITTDVLLHCFQYPSHNTLAIGSLLLQNCSTHLLCFEMWCLEPSNMEKLLDNMETFLPLIVVYLQMASKEDPARPKDVQKQVLKALNEGLLLNLSKCVLGNMTENSRPQQTEALSSLIKLSANTDDIRKLINNLLSALQNVESFERWKLIDVITEKLADFPEEKETWRKSVITAAIKCLTASYSNYKDQATSPEQERTVSERLCQHFSSSEDIAASEWNSFVKNGLKYRFKDHHFLNTLRSLLEVIYTDSKDQKDLISLSTIHMMTSTHSLFLPTMLDSGEEPTSKAKEALVSLLLCLVRKCPAVCNNNHFVVLMGAYGVTLSTLDQKLLLLLQDYEKNNVSLLKFQAFLWGPAAVEHHKTRKRLGASLWKQVGSDDMLALLNPDRMLQTVTHFPQRRKMMTQEDKELLHTNSAVKDLGNLYDPCFLLPLFSAILRPECVIDCLKFVSCHAMGVTVMALSSYDPKVRAAAYHVLSCFYQHLEGSQFREKRQLLYLMDTMKNGIRQTNQRLPFVLTTYVAKVAQQMLKPEDHMYVVLNRFLLSHQSLDFRRVPEFFKLFYGFDLEHKMEREWILHVLEEGMSDGQCFDLCDKQGIFQILLGFSSSPLCDEHCQAQIMKVLLRAAHVTRAAHNLTKSCGLLTWIIQMAERNTVDQQLLSVIIDLLHALWFTILGQNEKQMTAAEKRQSSVKCLPLPLINDFLCVALTISRHLRLRVRPGQLCLFLQTLCSVLKYGRTAFSLNTEAGRFTLPPQPLSCSQVLSLLHCWASLAHDTVLLTQLHELSEKHKLNKLFGKDKIQAKSHLSKARSTRQSLAEDSEIEKQESSPLMECKSYLCSIFVHWEPLIPVSEPQLVNSPQGLAPSPLANDTAQLLSKWCLRCLVEEPYDENRTKEFLFWAKKIVLEDKEIMNSLLDDSGWRANLLRLHHHTDVYCHSSVPSRVETLQIFTDIMICLLEAKGNLPVLHHAVVSACLSKSKQDQSRYEAGLFLFSLYISEMWSGATSAQMFLSHVSLVARTKCKIKKTSQSAVTQIAIKAVCDDIITSTS